MPEKFKGRRPIRRIVTGHDTSGRSVILSDAPSGFVMEVSGKIGPVVTDLWKTQEAPAENAGSAEACTAKIVLSPAPAGTIFRMVEFPPDRDYMADWDPKTTFSALDASAAVAPEAAAHDTPGMHRTDSVDYAFVMSGEIWAVMEEGEVAMQAGDVLIQRGTNHAWSNRSSEPAIIGFVLVGAKPLDAARTPKKP